MIVIEKPELEVKSDTVILSSKCQIRDDSKVLWYSFPLDFHKYIVTERLDAFVIGLLFLALKTGSDIHLKAPISARLHYTLNHYLIDALCLANPQFRKIRIFVDKLDETDLNVENIAGTGLSCGVDSFATYYDHVNEKGAYKIEYFTFFNVGSHGDYGGENSRKVFHRRQKAVLEFADAVGKKIIAVDSNLSEIMKMDFLQTNTLRNVSCVLTLQKLFRNYYLASKNRFDFFKLNPIDNQDYDSLILDLCSTESTHFFSSVSHLNRTGRTELISRFPETYDHLDVCTNPDHVLPTRNCSTCDKCMRTAFTLDLLGKLNLYETVFSIEEYQKTKKKYLGKLLATKGTNEFSQDIYNLMKKTGQISYSDYLYSLKYRFMLLKKILRKSIKIKA